MHKLGLLCVCALLLAVGFGTAGAETTIVVDKAFPTRGEATGLRIMENNTPVTGASVSVVYRPGSSVSREEEVGVSGTGGTINWTPDEAGIATLTATWPSEPDAATATTTVSVRFDSTPVGGVLIMVVAGVVLILGSFVRIFRLLRTPNFQ